MERMTTGDKYPFYIKVPAVLLTLCLLVLILHTLADILVPLAFATLIAILLNPVSNRLAGRFGKVPAIIISLLLAILVVAALLYFFSSQVGTFTGRLPELKVKSHQILLQSEKWSQQHFGINLTKQLETVRQGFAGGSGILRNAAGSMLGVIGVVVLLPIYVFLLLFYKPLLLDFLFEVFTERHSLRVAEILNETKTSVQSYMVGLMIETAIVSTLNVLALLVIGVPSAVVIGVLGGLLNVLPYIGGIVAIALPVIMVTLVRTGYTAQLEVIGAYALIQFIDNNFLVPFLVAKKVRINALLSIVVVLLGGALWGLSGMFLAIPFLGVLKIVFDRIDGLKPWGKLLGDEVPQEPVSAIWTKRWNRIFRRRAIVAAQAAAVDESLPPAEPNS
jgi:AI-2 transport protein TqsA